MEWPGLISPATLWTLRVGWEAWNLGITPSWLSKTSLCHGWGESAMHQRSLHFCQRSNDGAEVLPWIWIGASDYLKLSPPLRCLSPRESGSLLSHSRAIDGWCSSEGKGKLRRPTPCSLMSKIRLGEPPFPHRRCQSRR